MHLRVYDQDLLTLNDFLGEVKVSFAELAKSENSLYLQLVNKDGSDAGRLGYVRVMVRRVVGFRG